MAKCKTCHGLRKIAGIGFLETNCKACNGTGKQIEQNAQSVVNEVKTASKGKLRHEKSRRTEN